MGLSLAEFLPGAEAVGYRPGRTWLFSPEPLALSRAEVGQLTRLGHPLRRFQQACEQIYRRSVNGSLPPWIAEVVDAGKPAWMVEAQRSEALRMGAILQVAAHRKVAGRSRVAPASTLRSAHPAAHGGGATKPLGVRNVGYTRR